MEFIKKNCVALATANGDNHIKFLAATGKQLPLGMGDLSTQGIAMFNQLPETERRPKKLEQSEFFDAPPLAGCRGDPIPMPPGILVSRVYTRGLELDARGEPRPFKGKFRRESDMCSGPQRDFLWLTEAEWKPLVPKNPSKGMKYPLPEAIVKRIFCNHLIDNTISLSKPWKEEHVRSGELTLTVEEVSTAGVRLNLEGFASMANDADLAKASRKGRFSFLGVLNYDAEKEVFDRFDLVALGNFWPSESNLARDPGRTTIPLGVAFELASPDSLGYGVPPYGSQGGEGAYFGTDLDKKIRRYLTGNVR